MKNKKQGSPNSISEKIAHFTTKNGSLVTIGLMGALSFGLGYLIYSYLLSDWAESARVYRDQVIKKELENKKTEKMVEGEPEFLGQFKKVVDLYKEAKPLLPEETEISDVLGQVEAAAKRNGVTLTGLLAVKDSIKSPKAEKLYEREIPALVTGSYPQVVRFFTDVSRMSRILVVRDFSVVSLKDNVSAGFTLVAYHAPPPAEMPAVPASLAANQPQEVAK